MIKMRDERVQLFLRETGPVLALDIGALTQKVLLARPGWTPESWPRLLLPTPERYVTQRVRELTMLKRGIWFYGGDMGGGFADAVRNHIAAGLPVYSASRAAKSIHDNITLVEQIGVKIAETCPSDCVPVYLADYDPQFWTGVFNFFGLPQPHMVLAAVHDHGDHDNGNREARMKHWQQLLNGEPDPIHWIYETAPDDMSRLKSLQANTGGPVADTVTASILGALCDDIFFERCCRQGVTLIKAGNMHTFAALVYQAKVYGLYEHHTQKRGLKLLLDDLSEFRKRWLPTEKAHASGGQGTAFGKEIPEAGDWEPTYLLGPKRGLLRDHGQCIAPHGDMPHAGCFGLIYGWSRSHAHV